MDEKKKLMVMLALVAVMACIGAFQFLKPGAAPPPPSPTPAATGSTATPATPGTGATPTPAVGDATAKVDPKAKGSATDPKKPDIKNPQVANDLPARDPFSVPAGERPRAPSAVQPVATAKPRPFPQIRGSLSPANPGPMMGGMLGSVDHLPGAGGVAPSPMDRPKEDPFGYHVVGSIRGDRSAVVLQDAAGNQKLVPEGAAIDGESRVKRVDDGAVIIEYRGKKLRLKVGGSSLDKK